MSYNTITRETLDTYLRELAKEFRRLNGKTMPAEIILIGGASVLANYGFRNMTTDVDAIITATSAMKEAINRVGDWFSLPNGWLNTDFQNTRSYSPKLMEVSVYYKTFSNVLTVRTVSAEYLIAMKLISGRKYKNDLSDVIGILEEHRKKGTPISYERIDAAMRDLYGDWESVPADAVEFIQKVYAAPDYEALYRQYREEELTSRDALLDFDKTYPGALKEDNMAEILEKARRRMQEKGGAEPER